ncbi:hypothetical protein GQE99_01645 [Maritimibacter sp. DP07]|uniref:Flp pilus-assembly TadG-like N-terminal domain-containing protein n=1 Tax=Maritimibacter harenae TaxID=2606218 RepID=A0A845M6D8_9RHOB|nr:pilus assembly protein TadG-related protein [Maritimibacter harenae]MZR11721.1 hypothetical protein [Maritimibacter harenae]
MRWLKAKSFLGRMDGSVTVFGLYLFLATVAIGALALDIANAYRINTHLQVAADSAAHAALLTRETEDAAAAKSTALSIAKIAMPPERHGDVLRDEDIYFGYWDAKNESFQVDSSSSDAVLVDAGRLAERGNRLYTVLLRLFGQTHWDIRRSSVFETYIPTCFREGVVGEDVVEFTSNNLFKEGFCIHSNTFVSFNTGNEFETRSIVSMPDRREISIPSDGFAANPGLSDALRDAAYQLRVLSRVDEIISGVLDPSSPYFRDWIIPGSIEIELDPKSKLDDPEFSTQRIHVLYCAREKQRAKIHAGTDLKDLVIWTNCQLQIGENVTMDNVAIVNTNTGNASITGASGIQLGKDDNCAPGGGVQIVTKGGVAFPQYLKMFGGQIIASGDVSFTSDANGIQGASIVSGGRVDGTTDGVMAFCDGSGMEDNFSAVYFKLAY